MVTKAALDPLVQKSMVEVMISLYLGGEDRRNPLANPLYADLSGLPPLLVHVGENESLYDDAIRLARRAEEAGVSVKLKIWEHQIHVFQMFSSRLDEGSASLNEIGAFLDSYLT